MITLSQIDKHYGDFHALKNITLSVSAGEIMGVIGRSGAGKSTLIRCVNLLERPTQGSVHVNGIDLTKLSATALKQQRRHIGMIFQHFNLLATRTVYDNVAFPLRLIKHNENAIKKSVLELLERVGLAHYQSSYPHQLSGGQKQRVAIARALATQPKVLLCDEMTSALDPETTEDILQLLRSINEEMCLSILCITHEMQVIKSIADRVAVMDHGKIVECAAVSDIFKNPQHVITQKFVQSVMKSTVPASLQPFIHDARATDDLIVLRLTFSGETTLEPVICSVMSQMQMSFSILHANMEWLNKAIIGYMMVVIDLKGKSPESVHDFLSSRGLIIEVIGYVGRQHWLSESSNTRNA